MAMLVVNDKAGVFTFLCLHFILFTMPNKEKLRQLFVVLQK